MSCRKRVQPLRKFRFNLNFAEFKSACTHGRGWIAGDDDSIFDDVVSIVTTGQKMDEESPIILDSTPYT